VEVEDGLPFDDRSRPDDVVAARQRSNVHLSAEPFETPGHARRSFVHVDHDDQHPDSLPARSRPYCNEMPTFPLH